MHDNILIDKKSLMWFEKKKKKFDVY